MPKRMLSLFVCFIFLHIFLQPLVFIVQAKEKNAIYVSSNGIYCDYTTITEALEVAVPGTTIIVKDGIYTEEFIQISKSGEPGRPITIKGEKNNALLYGRFQVDGEYITISGLKMDGRSVVNGNAITVNQPYATITHMDVRNYIGYTVYCEMTRGNNVGGHSAYIAHNYTANMLAGFTITFDTILEYNEMEGVSTFGTTGANGDFCRVFGNNIVVRGNYYHGTRSENLKRPGLDDVHADFIQSWDDVAVETSNILVEDNIVFGKYHQGIMLENDRFVPEGLFYIHDWTIRNNIFAGYNAWAICSGKIEGGVPNLDVINNTFIADASNDTKTWHGVGFVGRGGSGIVKNNIFVGQYSSSYFTSDGATMDADYNLIYNAPAPQNPGPNDIIGSDPMFVKFDKELKEIRLVENDYRLSDVSPAIDKGEDLGIRKDLEGNRRPSGESVDIGAYEFQGKIGNTAPIVFLRGVQNGAVVPVDSPLDLSIDAIDPDGIAKAEFYYNDELVHEATEPPYTYSISPEKGTHLLYAKAYDSTGLVSQSGLSTIFVSNDSYVDGDSKWRSMLLDQEHSGKFSAEFSILAVAGETNGVVGISDGETSAYGNLAVGVRIAPNGVIDARSGGAYTADTEILYEPGKLYKIRLDIDIGLKTYDAYVTDENGRTRKLANKYEFRVKPNKLTHWCTYAESGGTKVFAFKSGSEVSGAVSESAQIADKLIFTIGDRNMMSNDIQLEIDSLLPTVPLLVDNVPMIPIRALIEALGGKLEWDDATQNLYMETEKDIVEIWVGKNDVLVNNKEDHIDTPPIIVESRIFVPIDFISEFLGFGVEWLEESQRVEITY